MTDSTTKQCRKCGTPRPLNSFTLDKRYADGHYPWCADCRRAWRQGRKGRQRELERNWTEQNRDRVRDLANQNYARNKDKIAPKRREYDRERWRNDTDFRARKNERDRIRKLKKRHGYELPAVLRTIPYDGPTKLCLCCLEDLPLYAFQDNNARADGLQDWCRTCRKLHADVPERKQARTRYDKQRRTEKGDALRVQSRERYKTDPEYREQLRQGYLRRKETARYKELQRQRHYQRRQNPQYRLAHAARLRYRRQHDPEYRRKMWHWRQKRRERIQTQGVPFKESEWIALCAHYDHRCLACSEQRPLTVDHVVPISRGGASDISNVQPLCIDCNRRKSTKTIDYRSG